jgi:hypothetical protein
VFLKLLFLLKFLCMKKVIVLVSLIFGLNGYSQLFVGSNSYMYVGDQFVYVEQDVQLQEDVVVPINGRIFLRREGQFLQGTTGLTANSGNGSLSVYQEGTSNNFGYNYWSSPVGNPVSGATYKNFGIGLLHQPTSVTASNPAIILAPSNHDGISSPLSVASRWIHKFTPIANGATVYADWIAVGNSYSVKPGEGFTMKGTRATPADTFNPGETAPNKAGDNQRYDFRGIPNDGNIAIDVADDKLTLTGNPYSSAINLNMFLLENSGYTIANDGSITGPNLATRVINGEALFWEHIKTANTHMILGYIGGYGTYVANNTNANSPGTYNNATWNTFNLDGTLNTVGGGAGTERYKRMFSPIGQGFFVKGLGTTGNPALMKNKYRVFVKESYGNNSQFERSMANSSDEGNWDDIPNVAGVDYTQFSKAQVPQVKIHTIINNLNTKEVTIAFNPFTTDGYDVAMEATSNENLASDAYLSIVGETKPYVISTLPFGIEKRIPYTLKASSTATYKVFVGNIINFDDLENVYLYDGLTGVYHDIKEGFFEISLPEGLYENRFEVTFSADALGVNNPHRNNLLIFQNNTAQNLVVSNPNLLEVKEIGLFDIAGKKIFEKKRLNVEEEYKLPTSGVSEAVYIVNVKTNKGNFSQKVVISQNAK